MNTGKIIVKNISISKANIKPPHNFVLNINILLLVKDLTIIYNKEYLPCNRFVKDCEEYSIGRVAKMLNLPVHTIRFWTEEFEHIECLRRKNRRYYDNKAVEELKKIKELSHRRGMKIEGIKQMLRYKKIDMDKLDEANKVEFQTRIETAIRKIDKAMELLSKC